MAAGPGYCRALSKGTTGWDSVFAALAVSDPSYCPPFPIRKGKVCPAVGEATTASAPDSHTPAVDGVGRVAAVADGGGRVSEKMLSKSHTPSSGAQVDACSELCCKRYDGCRGLSAHGL